MFFGHADAGGRILIERHSLKGFGHSDGGRVSAEVRVLKALCVKAVAADGSFSIKFLIWCKSLSTALISGYPEVFTLGHPQGKVHETALDGTSGHCKGLKGRW